MLAIYVRNILIYKPEQITLTVFSCDLFNFFTEKVNFRIHISVLIYGLMCVHKGVMILKLSYFYNILNLLYI